MQNTELSFDGNCVLPVPGYRARLQAVEQAVLDKAQCVEFFALLGRAQRPLIYAGGGVISANAARALREFAHAFGIPVATTLMGLGACDTTEPLALHMLGMHGTAYANYAVEDCDFCWLSAHASMTAWLACPASSRVVRSASPISMSIRPRSARSSTPTGITWATCLAPWIACAYSGRKQAFMSSPQHRYASWHAHIADLKTRHAMNYARDGALIQPHALIEEINRHARGRAIITTGVGQHQMWAAQYFDFCEPRLWLTSGSMGTMGFGLPAAVGAQFACPGALVIDIDGDASIRMNIGELRDRDHVQPADQGGRAQQPGRRHGAAMAEIVLPGSLCSQRQEPAQERLRQGRAGRRLPMGAPPGSAADVAATIAEFIDFKGPAFLEVMIDPMPACIR